VPVWDLVTGKPRRHIQTGGSITDAIAFHPSGEQLLACVNRPDKVPFTRLHGQALLWRLETDEPAKVVCDPDTIVFRAEFSPDGSRAAVSTCRQSLIFDAGSWQVERTIDPDPDWNSGIGAVFSSDGSKLAGVQYQSSESGRNKQGMIAIRDVDSGQCVRRVIGEERDGSLHCSFSPDGKAIAAAMGFPARFGENVFQVRVFGVDAGNEIARLDVPIVWHAIDVLFSPDGSLLASCTADGAVILWDVGAWRQRCCIQPHTGSVRIAFSPDGRRLASVAWDGLVKIWDVARMLDEESPQELVTLVSLDDGDNWLAYTPDGRYDCSPGAEDTLLWRKGTDFLTADQCAAQYHSPGLLATVLSP
jgi:WD40 repeat protein